MNLRRLILAACISCGLTPAGLAAQGALPQRGGPDAVTRRESKRLEKTFGLVLPDSAKVTAVLKTPQTKVTYLLIQMSGDEGRLFKTRLSNGPSPGHPKIQPAMEDTDCVEREDIPCMSIGSVRVPRDRPDDIIDKWYEDKAKNC